MKPSFSTGTARQAFTLMEVMIASVIFCVGMFAILGLVSSSLENARRLQRPTVDAGVLAAQLSTNNQLVEGTYTGNLGDLLGKDYDSYTWTEVIEEVRTNKLFHVDIAVQSAGGNHEVISEVNLLLFRPASPAGSLDGGNFIKR